MQFEPVLKPLTGCQVWTRQSEESPQAWEHCPVCYALRNEAGEVLELEATDQAGEPVGLQTGIQTGHPYVCLKCQCVAPEVQRQLRRLRPRSQKKRARQAWNGDTPVGGPKLSYADRKALAETIPGRAFVACLDAEESGERVLAGRLRVGLTLLSHGKMTEEELGQLIPRDS
jgi:hypothetical protein